MNDVLMTRKCGARIAAKNAKVTQRTVQRWVKNYELKGVRGLRTDKKSGSPPIISYKIINKLASRLAKRDNLYPTILIQSVNDKAEHKYSRSNIRKILHKLGFHRIVLSTGHQFTPEDEEARQEWQKDIKTQIPCLKSEGYKIIVQDEAIFHYEPRPRKGRWTKIDVRPHTRATGRRIKAIVYGALCDDGTHLFRNYGKFNGRTFLKYLKEMVANGEKFS